MSASFFWAKTPGIAFAAGTQSAKRGHFFLPGAPHARLGRPDWLGLSYNVPACG